MFALLFETLFWVLCTWVAMGVACALLYNLYHQISLTSRDSVPSLQVVLGVVAAGLVSRMIARGLLSGSRAAYLTIAIVSLLLSGSEIWVAQNSFGPIVIANIRMAYC
jgi:hypothetical protein